MYIQGHLQSVFDALYHLGVIDPVLDMDWGRAMDEMIHHMDEFQQIVEVVNLHQSDPYHLAEALRQFDSKSLSYLAMEVAREYADYHSRDQIH